MFVCEKVREVGVGRVSKMDLNIVKEVLDVKINNQYPAGLTNKQQYVIKRRADKFRIKGEDACHVLLTIQ